MMYPMPSKHHRRHKWRRFVRTNPGLVFAMVFLIIILGVVVLIFWMLTSSRFIKIG